MVDPPPRRGLEVEAKFDAWVALKGVSKDKAMRAYVGLAERLKSQIFESLTGSKRAL